KKQSHTCETSVISGYPILLDYSERYDLHAQAYDGRWPDCYSHPPLQSQERPRRHQASPLRFGDPLAGRGIPGQFPSTAFSALRATLPYTALCCVPFFPDIRSPYGITPPHFPSGASCLLITFALAVFL